MIRPLAVLALLLPILSGQRITVPLDGEWAVEDSIAADRVPSSFTHTGAVPGLTNTSTPAFPDVDRFDSQLIIDRKIQRKLLPPSAAIKTSGVPRQERNYFWYRKTFRAPARKRVAILRINKAQFGTAVWLNGKKIGDHLGCFTAGYFDLTPAVDWAGENTLVVRIGAHPAVLPESAPSGTDAEKNRWTPGIYDSVSVAFADNPVIESVQVAPRLGRSEIVIQTAVRNYGAAGTFTLSHRVKPWKGQAEAGRSAPQTLVLKAGETKTVTETLRLPNARLWTPEDPFLYVLESGTGGDTLSTRFGMREFRFDTATKRAYLNGKPYFLRGSNITLHRFFEDPKCGRLPWDEAWVRKLLSEIPRRLHWNSFRFCIGPVPDRWLEIADEAGLLIQNEFFVWQYRKSWDMTEMISQYKEWMRDNWNHPSVAIWDAQNETRATELTEIIHAVRGLDLSNRPWENGYNDPEGPDDPVEDHPYLFSRLGKGFEPVDLEKMTGAKSTNSAHPSGHAALINEYGWLWLNRDGSPTELTGDIYARLAGPQATPEQRFELDAYYLAGLTEFWRAHRNFAGVLHFVHLAASYPPNMPGQDIGAYTSDHFIDVEKLVLEPRFENYMSEAFKPLGVYVNFWRESAEAGSGARIPVMMVNDDGSPVTGRLRLTIASPAGEELSSKELKFDLPGLGAHTYAFDLKFPAQPGAFVLKASAYPEGSRHKGPTVSRRKFAVR